MREMNEGQKVLVALSGGLDSAAAVLLLRERGFDTQAVYFDNLGDVANIEKVRHVARNLNIELHIVDARELFASSVINYLKTELIAGRTPAPCAFCNTHLKWRLLVDTADNLGITLIATGHYAQISHIHADESGDVAVFRRGADPVKDQTYYLWNVTPAILDRTILPLGGMTKNEVRNYLIDKGFETLGRGSESMSLCFLPRGVAYPDFVKKLVAMCPGDIIDQQGIRIGSHDGYPLYTIGQQRGLDIPLADGRTYSVVRICPEDNVLIVSDKAGDLYTKTLIVRDYITHSEALYGDGVTVLVRGLGRNPTGFGRVVCEGERLCVELENSAWAVAPGQPVVFYQGDLLLGGGYAE